MECSGAMVDLLTLFLKIKSRNFCQISGYQAEFDQLQFVLEMNLFNYTFSCKYIIEILILCNCNLYEF